MLLVAVGLTGLGSVGHRAYRDFNPYAWKPTSWLIRDAVVNRGARNDPNVVELLARIRDGRAGSDHTEALAEATLTVQGDRSIVWPRPWQDIAADLVAQDALTDEQLTRFLQQSLTVKVGHRPVIRQRYFRFNGTFSVDMDRNVPNLKVRGTQTRGPLTIDSMVVMDLGKSLGTYERGEDRQPTARWGNGGTFCASPKDFSQLEVGEHAVRQPVTFDLTVIEPFRKTVSFTVEGTSPIKVVGPDATVDAFVVDPEQTDAMARAVTPSLRKVPNGLYNLILTFQDLPVAVAAKVYLVRGDTRRMEGVVRQDVVEPIVVSDRARWRWRDVGDNGIYSPKVERDIGQIRAPPRDTWEVVLEPSQDAADGALETGPYWAEPLNIGELRIDP